MPHESVSQPLALPSSIIAVVFSPRGLPVRNSRRKFRAVANSSSLELPLVDSRHGPKDRRESQSISWPHSGQKRKPPSTKAPHSVQASWSFVACVIRSMAT